MRNILLTISYTGTHFHGYQYQPGLRTVEGELKKAIDKVVGKPTKLMSAGRTDAGVHALGQLANFRSDIKIDLGNLPRVINCYLADDLSVTQATQVPLDFHARYFAKKKHYRYIILNNKNRSGIYANRVAHWPFPLDIEKMEEALMKIKGEHDFSAYVGRFAAPSNPVRTLDQIKIKKKGQLIQTDFYGKSFLKNQIRIIMGTTMEIGRGVRDVDSLYRATLTGDRKDLGHTADPSGLYLMNIEHSETYP